MSEQIHEQLSALVDGELGRDEARFLIRRLERDDALMVRWTRYHLIRQGLRRQALPALRADFLATTLARLHEEATVRRATPWLRWASGGAIAAGVAAAALMFGGPQPQPASRPGTAATMPSPSLVGPARVEPVAMSTAPTAPALELSPPLLTPLQPVSWGSTGSSFGNIGDPRLQSYLIRHYEAANAAGQGGFVPYALLVVPPHPARNAPVREATDGRR
jgi:sigma-E factor negative regulatory protein RseA